MRATDILRAYRSVGLLLTALVAAPAAFGAVPSAPPARQVLLKISNNEKDAQGNLIGDYNLLSAELDANRQLVRLVYESRDKRGKPTMAGGAIRKPLRIGLAPLKNAPGVVLERDHGIDALTLSGKLSPATGGNLSLRFVNDVGMLGETYKSCGFQLRTGPAGWEIAKGPGGPVVRTAELVIHATGIKTIKGICDSVGKGK